MAIHLNNHPDLARFAGGWARVRSIYGDSQTDLWQAYCRYVVEEGGKDPLYYNEWLALYEADLATEESSDPAISAPPTEQICSVRRPHLRYIGMLSFSCGGGEQ